MAQSLSFMLIQVLPDFSLTIHSNKSIFQTSFLPLAKETQESKSTSLIWLFLFKGKILSEIDPVFKAQIGDSFF